MSSQNEASTSFHSFPQMSHQEKTDIRRVQGQISCAECRRLKLRCDKKIPCSSCVRRGCVSLCPTKALATAPTKRIITSDTTALHKKIRAMNQHIGKLEDALSTLQATVSSEPHPLLAGAPRLPKIEQRTNSFSDDWKTVEIVDALGTLSLGKEVGDARYLGRSAVSESLLEGSPEIQGVTDEDDFIPTHEIAQLVNSFPFAPDSIWDVESSMKLILSYLPERERAWALAEQFLTHNFWYIRTVSREELFDELLTPIYQFSSFLDDAGFTDLENTVPLPPTRLAVLFICLALGSLADLSTPMYSTESALFFNLSRATLALHPVLVSPDLASIQALTLIGSYYGTGGPNYSIEATWVCLTFAAKLTHSLGLHRESPRWGLDDKTIQRRRAIFWELYTFDGLISLDLGRPPSLFTAHSDTPLPFDDDDGVDDQGNPEPGFHRWRMTFSRDVMTAISNVTLSPGMPDYQTILDLDRLVREHPLPQKYDPLRSLSNAVEKGFTSGEEGGGYEVWLMTLKGHHLNQFRAVVVMHVHRAFFAQALLQSPSDPLGTVYAPSFLAAYQIASTMVHLNVKNFYKYPNVLSRYWEIWTGLLSAGIILGLIVARSPSNPIAADAYEELELAVDLFKMGAPKSDKARRSLNVLLRMYEKATKAYVSTTSPGNTAMGRLNVVREDADALHTLETFAGYTKLLMKKMRSSRRTPDTQRNEFPEASGQYQSDTSDSEMFPSSEHVTQSTLESRYSFPFSSPSSSSSSYPSPSSAAGQSNDPIPLWQSPTDLPVDRPGFISNTSKSSSSGASSYSSQSYTSGISSFRYGPGTSRDVPPAAGQYHPPTRSTTQREYWNDNQDQLTPLPVHHRGGYDAKPSWVSTQAQGSDPYFESGTSQSRGHMKQGPFSQSPPSQTPFAVTPLMMSVDAQWVELMRDEGVYGPR
ncbi:fungal-specific transcription factor domain-containing protein [Lentinula edodes]|uniref:fungal-specific transcription factor domain-containing protein n=1 Tax=Lentinula edodes TaxID=5353 RepID=UPI001E8D5CCC|nr:fungal-specific transcription factor domain-containing protein [Lentinula edodes]KAH7868571.1 fungal-specific transcription factor domain-containing protein [Lentinula edodes]